MATTTNTTKTAHFTIDFLDKKIIGTKASFNKASKGSGPEYEELTAKIAAHPKFELVVKAPEHKSKKAKPTYKGMDDSFMKEYISIQPNAKQLLKEYEAVKTFAKARATANGRKVSVYPAAKKWFFKTFDPNDEGFDITEAKKQISKAMIKDAVSSVKDSTADSDSGEVA